MKRNVLLILAMIASLMMSFIACDTKTPIDDPEEDPKQEQEVPIDSVAVIDTTESGLPMFSFPAVPNLPLEVGNLLAEGTDVGVTIEVTAVEHQNFVFELRPGAMIQSFRFDVFPLSQLYNSLLNDGMVGSDAVDIKEHIRDYLFAEDGNGGFQISVKDFGSAEDFLQIEYDWMSTTFAPATAIAIPDCDYVIAVVACTDDQASSATQEELTLCFVHTTSEALIGDPQVDIEVTTGYTAFGVNHIPNADAAGVYFFGWLTEEIDAYINVFGNRLFRDFMRTRVSSPSPSTDPDGLRYTVNYGSAADHRIKSTTCAVAVDANLTPAENFSRKDFNLLEIPQDQPEATVTVDIIDEKVAAAYFEFQINFSADCQTFFMRLYTEEQKLALEQGTAEARAAEATDMAVNGGWGCHNPNFKNGEAGTVRDNYFGGLKPGETYYMGFTGRNKYQTLSDLSFSEPIVLDERNFESPDNCQVKDFTVEVNKIRRTSYNIDIYYDPATVSMVYVSYFFPGAEGFPLTKESTWSEWMGYIFGATESGTGSTEYSNMNVNAWPTTPNGYDYWGVTGMTPGTEYTVFVCAEDYDGNISDVKLVTITTTTPNPGPDPTMEITLAKTANASMGEWEVTFRMVKDVKEFYYCLVEPSNLQSELGNTFTQNVLENIVKNGTHKTYTYQMVYDAIYNFVSQSFTEGGNGEGGMHTDSEDTYLNFNGNKAKICACIAVGEDQGIPVYKLFTAICSNGQLQTLEQVYRISE